MENAINGLSKRSRKPKLLSHFKVSLFSLVPSDTKDK
jgi:hypothetical protein